MMIRTMTESEYQDLAALAKMPTDAIKRLWDEYDGCNCPGGISGETIHEMLNARGEGRYCAV